MRGTVKAIKKDKGYAFLRDENGVDRFFHANHLENTTLSVLQEGDAVEFEPYDEPSREDGKRARAREVRVV